MEIEASSPCSDLERKAAEKATLLMKMEALQAVIEQCQRVLESLGNTEGGIENEDGNSLVDYTGKNPNRFDSSSGEREDHEADELCELLKSRVECPDFLKKLECAQVSFPQDISEEGSSWDMVSGNDLWGGDQEDYVLVRQEDIVDGIACFMAKYLLSLKQAKDLTPNQLQEALSKTFSSKKNKGKLRKAWDGSKVIYNVASWGATAIGIYQNPVILRVATKAFWTSCQVISKLL